MFTLKNTTIVAASIITLTAGAASADVLNVPTQYGTIQSAINAAQFGDTVQIADGFYDEDFSIQGKTLLFIKGSGLTFVKTAQVQNSNGITFQDLRFQLDPSQGIAAINVTSLFVANCKFADCQFGISSNGGLDMQVADCNFVRSSATITGREDLHMLRTKFKNGNLDLQNIEGGLIEDCKFINSNVFSNSTQDVRWEDNLYKKSRLMVINGFDTEIVGNTFKKPYTLDQGGYNLWIRLFGASRVEGNTFKRTGPLGGMRIEGRDALILNNFSKKSQGRGMYLTNTASGNRIEGNTVIKSTEVDLHDESAPGSNEFVNNEFDTTN